MTTLNKYGIEGIQAPELNVTVWIDGEGELNHEHTSYVWVDKTECNRYEAMLGTEQDIVLLNIWPKEIFPSDRLGVLPQPAR